MYGTTDHLSMNKILHMVKEESYRLIMQADLKDWNSESGVKVSKSISLCWSLTAKTHINALISAIPSTSLMEFILDIIHFQLLKTYTDELRDFYD